jgi:hypothetical protein
MEAVGVSPRGTSYADVGVPGGFAQRRELYSLTAQQTRAIHDCRQRDEALMDRETDVWSAIRK